MAKRCYIPCMDPEILSTRVHRLLLSMQIIGILVRCHNESGGPGAPSRRSTASLRICQQPHLIPFFIHNAHSHLNFHDLRFHTKTSIFIIPFRVG